MSKQEFWKHGASGSSKGLVITGSVICFICGILNVMNIFTYLSYGYPTMALAVAIDMVAFIGLGLGLLLARSRTCAVIAAAYYLIGKILIFTSGVSVAVLIVSLIFVGLFIMGVVGAFNFHKEYKYMMYSQANPYQNNAFPNNNPYQNNNNAYPNNNIPNGNPNPNSNDYGNNNPQQ